MDKIYVGNGKQFETKFGSMLKLSFSQKDLETMLENVSDKWYINLSVNERREVWKYWDTHTISLDTKEKKEDVNLLDTHF